MNLTGTITSLPDAKGNVSVQMGIFNSQVNISDLEIIQEKTSYSAKNMQRTSQGKLKMGKSYSVRPEINLLGKTVDEAIAELDKYLDDAYLAHLSPVRIVHGKGTGALSPGLSRPKRPMVSACVPFAMLWRTTAASVPNTSAYTSSISSRPRSFS